MSDAPTTSTADVDPPEGLPDISSWDFWTGDRSERAAGFRRLRDTPGLPFYPERTFEDSPLAPGPGYYAVTRQDDVWHASRSPELFCSGRGGVNIGDLNQELSEFFGSMISMDDPKHFRLRSIVSKGFTPKHISAVEDQVKHDASSPWRSTRSDAASPTSGRPPSPTTCRATSSTRSSGFTVPGRRRS